MLFIIDTSASAIVGGRSLPLTHLKPFLSRDHTLSGKFLSLFLGLHGAVEIFDGITRGGMFPETRRAMQVILGHRSHEGDFQPKVHSHGGNGFKWVWGTDLQPIVVDAYESMTT